MSNQDFVAIANQMLQASSEGSEDANVSAALVETMANQLEITFINNQLLPRVQRLRVVKRNLVVKQKTPKKSVTPSKTIVQAKFAKIHGVVNFFCDSWAKQRIGQRENEILHSIRCKPERWIRKMDLLYSQFTHTDGKYSLNLSTMEELKDAYLAVDSTSVYTSALEFRKFKAYHNWLAVAIAVVISRRTKTKGKELYEKLKEYQDRVTYPKQSYRIVKKLANHCWRIHEFYQAFGDHVILSPDLYEKRFLLEYPEEELNKLFKDMKKGLPKSILQYKRFVQ